MRVLSFHGVLVASLVAVAAGCSADAGAGDESESSDDLVFHGMRVGALDMSLPDVDAVGYEVAIEVDETTPKKETYRATTRGTFVATRALDALTLDFAGNDIDSIRVGGRAATFTRDGDKLTVKLPSTIARTRAFVVETKYHGAVAQADGADPNDFAAFGGLTVLQKNAAGKKIYASLNWPSKGRRWIPMRDHPRDGAMLAMRATFPDKYTVVSNGKRAGATKNAGGTKTWEYEALTPMPVYDFSLTAYDDWAETEARAKSGVPVHTYTYAGSASVGRSIYADVPAALDFYEATFGPYRWGQVSYLEEPIFGGGMEHASVISMDQTLFSRSEVKESRETAFHELAHHWSGNLVRIGTWNDFWLSEGFTDYLSRRAVEAIDGPEAGRAIWRETLSMGLADEASNPHALRPADPEVDVLSIFDSITYKRGAFTLRMLEARLGRPKLDAFLKGWFDRHALSPVTTAMLRDEIAGELGQDQARAFFDGFVFGAGHPEYSVSTAPKNGKLEITVKQLQSTGPEAGFTFPLTIELASGAQKQRVELAVAGRTTTSLVDVSFQPTSVIADPDETLYATVVCDGAPPCRDGYTCRAAGAHKVCLPR